MESQARTSSKAYKYSDNGEDRTSHSLTSEYSIEAAAINEEEVFPGVGRSSGTSDVITRVLPGRRVY